MSGLDTDPTANPPIKRYGDEARGNDGRKKFQTYSIAVIPGDRIGKEGARRFAAWVAEPVADNPVLTTPVAPILEARAAVINRFPVLDEIVPRAAPPSAYFVAATKTPSQSGPGGLRSYPAIRCSHRS